MTGTRKLLGAAAFSLAVAGGGVAGAVLGNPSSSGAQDGSDDTTTTEAAAEGATRGRGDHDGERLATAAEALGISEDELRSSLEDGQSIAQVAEDRGVDVQTVIDVLVAAGTERLQELEASLPERMTDLVNRTDWDEHHGPGRGGPMQGHLGLDAAAEAIGITTDELRAVLQDGSTIAAVAEAHDVSVQDVIDAMVADATASIDEAVAAGRIDADRAADIKADLVERVTAHVNGEHPARPDGPAAGDAAD